MRYWPLAIWKLKRQPKPGHNCAISSAISGATAIEYALIAGGIALAIVVALTLASGNVGDMYDSVASALGGG